MKKMGKTIRKIKGVPTILFLSILIFLISHGGQKAEWKGKIEYKDGVKVIKNPREPIYGKDVFLLEEDLSIGDKEIGNDYAFEVISTIRADNDGNIYVLDGKAQQVKVFNKNGKYIRNIGKKGQGPGEFEMPCGLHIISGKEIMVSSITRRLSFFSLQGKYLKQTTQSPDPFLIPDSKRNFIALIRSPGEKYVRELKKFNSSLEPIFTIGKIERKLPLNRRKRNPISTLIHFTVLRDDSIVWGINSQYQLMIVESRGKLIRKITKDYDPVKITEEYKQNFLKGIGALARARGVTYEFPENHPAFQGISTDDEGRIFVLTYENDKENNRYYDVYDSEGKYIAKIALKNNPKFWKKNRLYTAEEDEEGYQYVKRYKVTWKY